MSNITKASSNGHSKPIAIYYEHPEWFRPLFEQLDARGVPWVKIDARQHRFDPASLEQEYSLVFNRMSPSAWQRGAAHAIFYTRDYLKHLETRGVRVVNGYRGFTTEISKAMQLSLLDSLGLPYPKAIVVNHVSQVLSAAKAIGYPLIFKPNIGGSGAGIKKFTSLEDLQRAIDEKALHFGIDNIALIQECFTPRNETITRVEVLGGKYLYAIQIHTTGETFDLCPGDICQTSNGVELGTACVVEGAKRGLKVQGYEAPRQVIEDVERIMAAAGIEVGGIEYVVDDRTGRQLYYDINALSNFVADPMQVIGFNPYSRLADYLIAEAGAHARAGDPAPEKQLVATQEAR
ncbi:MAG TPA: hypothetical protein VGI16_08085 [Candidatus Acidoferrum sp.]